MTMPLRRLLNVIYYLRVKDLDEKQRRRLDEQLDALDHLDDDTVAEVDGHRPPVWWQGEDAAAREAAEVQKFLAARRNR